MSDTDRICQLEAEIEKLRTTLQGIAKSDDMYEPAGWAIRAARAALAERKEPKKATDTTGEASK